MLSYYCVPGCRFVPMMSKRFFAVASLLAFLNTGVQASENLLREADFGKVGRPGSAWQVAADKSGVVESTKAADGKTPALHLKAAAVTQQATFGEGLFELTVEACGQGELVLSISGAGERSQMLGKNWGTHGYLFQAGSGTKTVAIRAVLDGAVTVAAIRPAAAADRCNRRRLDRPA